MLIIMVQIFSLCWQIFPCVRTKFPVFSLSGKSKNQIPCFPCAVAILLISLAYGTITLSTKKNGNIKKSAQQDENLFQRFHQKINFSKQVLLTS